MSAIGRFHCVSHVNNVGVMKLLEMTKRISQRPIFCKRLTYVTSTCNPKVTVSSYSRNCKNWISYIPVHISIPFCKFWYLVNGPRFNYQQSPERKILWHSRSLEEFWEIKKWNKGIWKGLDIIFSGAFIVKQLFSYLNLPLLIPFWAYTD